MPGVTLDHLKSVICQLKDKVNEFDVKFSGPLRNRDLLTFENENTVRLPEDYRLFLTLVGNGGSSGPCREGLLPLGKVPSILHDKRSRVLRGLPDLFPFTEPSVITSRPANNDTYQQSSATNVNIIGSSNSNSEQDIDDNSDADNASDSSSDEMDMDRSGVSESQDEYDTDASNSSDNADDGDESDGYGIGISGNGSSGNNTNDEDTEDKYIPSTRTLFEDLFQLYDYPPFSVQRHDIRTLNNGSDSRINDDDSDMTIPMVGGYVILGTTEHSRHYFWILIASGINRGEVWIMNTNGFYFPTNTRMQFHQWIDDWISGSEKINASIWTCGLYDLQLRVSSRYRNRYNNYTSIYDSSTSSDDDDDDDQEEGDTDTECSYDDDTDSFDDDMTV